MEKEERNTIITGYASLGATSMEISQETAGIQLWYYVKVFKLKMSLWATVTLRY